MPSPKLRLDRSRHAAPQVFEHLRDQIMSLDLAPGTPLSRVTLAETYGVSQTPIRDALMKLAEEALVEIYPQHTTVVSRIDIAAARQAHFLRRSIELEIVHLLAQKPDALLIQRLQASIERQRVCLAAGEYPQFMAADQAFHRDMHVAAGVSALWDMEQRYSGHVDRLRRLHLPEAGKAARIMDDHQRVLDAIAAGDAARAQQALREHLSGTLNQVADICKRYPDYVLAD
ncbi:MAG: GntR family transcriptional regulator [Achromobacter pulmonis]|uniref:HTH-type transcriptional repressor RspR n=1 Tax=Achromobacter pulmonis TaxID=1389932 RepID=A0A6S7DPS8_9BURK|nr:GntR family transcriptional regulator [Achromobacter pulmonis]CAB3633030.1 HTH-type transcriptional repressor RspR [Achromobacter pulmonis]CAB3828347.1 HTH-type transcriptional repressor RspR [Achromobacter pulmonis]